MPDVDQEQSFEIARAGLPDIEPQVSVVWKPLQRLFGDGNPIDPVTILYYDLREKGRLPFAAIGKTRGNRLILWPPSDARQPGEFASGEAFAMHHITLEFSSGETHFTKYATATNRVHKDRGWRLGPVEGGLSMWLIAAFQTALLQKQAGALEQNIKMPTTDSTRRVEEFKRYAAEMSHVDVKTPSVRGDCFVTVIHLMDSAFRGPIEPNNFPMGPFWNDWIDGWPDGDKFEIVPTGINVGGINLVLLTASPRGRLKGACFIGGGLRQRGGD
jgi:hypothetical protein